MPSTVEQLSPTRAKLTVEIPFAELKPHLDKAYQEIASQVAVPGFRKGKVPAAVIDQRFGRGVVLQEAINEALPAAYSAAVAEAELRPMGQPEVEVTDLEDNDKVVFVAEVDVRPEFDLPDFSTIAVTVDDAESEEGELEERIDLLRQRFATVTEVDREAQQGDVVELNLEASQNGEVLPEATAEGVTYRVGDNRNMLDGLEDAVTGLKAGDETTFTSTLVGGPNRGQEADIKVTVTKVSDQQLPEVDDEFAQMVSEFDTAEEMREDLARALEAQRRQLQMADARDKVLEAAIAQVEFEAPEGALKAEQEARRNQVQRQLAQSGLTVEAYLEQAEDEDAETVEEFWANLDERSTDALRAQMLLDAWADEHEVPVSQQDLTELIFRRAQENGTSPQDEINHMMEHNHMAEWTQEIRRSKALAAMCAAATVKDSAGNVIEMPEPVLEDETAPESVAAESADDETAAQADAEPADGETED